jgi:hypothetical protein
VGDAAAGSAGDAGDAGSRGIEVTTEPATAAAAGGGLVGANTAGDNQQQHQQQQGGVEARVLTNTELRGVGSVTRASYKLQREVARTLARHSNAAKR